MMLPGKTLGVRRSSVLLLALAGVLATNLANSAYGEERKFTLLCADPQQVHRGGCIRTGTPQHRRHLGPLLRS